MKAPDVKTRHRIVEKRLCNSNFNLMRNWLAFWLIIFVVMFVRSNQRLLQFVPGQDWQGAMLIWIL